MRDFERGWGLEGHKLNVDRTFNLIHRKSYLQRLDSRRDALLLVRSDWHLSFDALDWALVPSSKTLADIIKRYEKNKNWSYEDVVRSMVLRNSKSN